ncbi:hypothetical protein SEVIR_9G140400v4 [Setaria viridis]|uniref:CSC1/OSCA1-like 7TM region domain-containing protein n=1 Tax=Setaria viridis TaxID=4556 RepID=A0A4U6SVK0_SETVI|nr:CSC1-like protein RXW8 [Setaria viridis]XP_034575408.1 CSC1-like protein RXW8 [Setaria viridis]TKV92083.1 hypothetical protein SEVIR_9G140400v2 [Setaria viridis]
MKVGGLLTSAGINIGLCVLFLSLYSILRKQPQNVKVYFGRRIAEEHNRLRDAFILERFVPSPSWIVKSLRCTEDEILDTAGLDAVVFNRIMVFSIRIFSLAAILCVFGVLPLNYFGQDMHHVRIPSASLETFTIGNVQERSRWLWVHCVVLYIISAVACVLLYFEYKHIARLRLCHISRATSNPRHFTVLVQGIPKSTESFSRTVENFFTKYHASSYLSHQVVYKVGKVQKIVSGAKKVYRKFRHSKGTTVDKRCRSITFQCCFCGASSNSFQLLPSDFEQESEKPEMNDSSLSLPDEECGAAFIFFKTRYAALVVAKILQTSNPMRWVTSLAPERDDIYWSNLWLPYKQLWIRHIATLLGSIVFMFLFLMPVTFIQGLTQLEQLQQRFPFLRGILEKKYMTQLITGYLPSVILQIFLYTVPPTMMLFSTLEGPISHSERKKSACCKVLYFTIWNVFFVNVLSGSAISQVIALSSPKDIPMQLARAVPVQATFFTTYVLTSGWASLSSELMQLFGLTWNFIRRYILRMKEEDLLYSFPYHTEVPKVLLFGLLGFTCSVLAPLILPFLLIYFCLGYVVYRNQFLNVYCTKYDTGGLYWPIAHNTTIFSLVLSQIICLGVFGLKESPVASGFTVPLIIFTLLFNQYCRKRHLPLFKTFPAQSLIDMDKEDQQMGRTEDLHDRLHSAYFQFPDTDDIPLEGAHNVGRDENGNGTSGESSRKESADDDPKDDLSHPTLAGLPVSQLRNAVISIGSILRPQRRELPV